MSLESFPDELLFSIFSYLGVEDLVLSIQHVCGRWREVSRDPRLWENLVFRPTKGEDESRICSVLEQGNGCNLVNEFRKIESILDKKLDSYRRKIKEVQRKLLESLHRNQEYCVSQLRKAPELHSVILEQEVDAPSVVGIMCRSCRDLRRLQFCSEQKLATAVLQSLQERFPDIECLVLAKHEKYSLTYRLPRKYIFPDKTVH